MKEKNKTIDTDLLGDAYCFVGMERNTKLILFWHLGRRTASDTRVFMEMLREATAGRFVVACGANRASNPVIGHYPAV